MKSKKNKKDKDKNRYKSVSGPQSDDHQGGQSMQHEEASQREMLQKLKSLPEDEFNSKFEKMLVRNSIHSDLPLLLVTFRFLLSSIFGALYWPPWPFLKITH